MLNQFKTKLVSFSRHHVFFRRSRGVFWVIKDDFFAALPFTHRLVFIYQLNVCLFPVSCFGKFS